MSFITLNNIKFHYQTLGEGPLITILGGLGDSARNWSTVTQQLSAYFKILLFDQRGSGQSDKPAGPYTIAQMAKDVAALWQELQITQTHLLGFSMGGRVAMQLALDVPHLINKMILVSTAAIADDTKERRTLLHGFAHTAEHFRAQFDLLFSPNYRRKFTSDTFVKFKMNDPFLQPTEAFRAQYQAVENCDLRNGLHLIQTPTLILAGTADTMTPYKNSEYLHAHIANSELVLYPDVGHIPQAEDTKRFVKDVTLFLQTPHPALPPRGEGALRAGEGRK